MPPDKKELREIARRRRRSLFDPAFAAKIACYAQDIKAPEGAIIGAYHARGEEADPSVLLTRLVELGCHMAFPRVRAKDTALDYHLVPDGHALAPGWYGTYEPSSHWPRATPDLLLVPLLAFDASGHRLGYGGGFFDRTLAALKVPGIGIAFAGQEVSSLPHGQHDMALDAVITEKGLRLFHESSVSG